ncbi:MAG: hypothetical protein WCF44_04070, partial [Candidatus Methylophosphatis roskildensis]
MTVELQRDVTAGVIETARKESACKPAGTGISRATRLRAAWIGARQHGIPQSAIRCGSQAVRRFR